MFAVAFLSPFCSLSESMLPPLILIKKKITMSIKTGTFFGFLFVWGKPDGTYTVPL